MRCLLLPIFLVLCTAAQSIPAAGQVNPAAAATQTEPVVVQHVNFVGGDHVPAMDREKFAKDLEGTARIPELRQKVADFWHSFGFFRVDVEAEPHLTGNKWGGTVGDITFKITEGPQYRLEQVRWSGATVFTPAQLNAMFPVKSGDVFDTNEVRRGVSVIRQAYAGKGYSQVAAIPAMRVDDAEHTITLDLHIKEGIRQSARQ